MSNNKRLVPTCIIYIDGVRMNTVCEGAFRSVHVTDTLNKISTCFIRFDFAGLTEADFNNFAFESRVSIHLGYKDEMSAVFDGEITDIRGRYEEGGGYNILEVSV